MTRILVLGGTTEARDLCAAMAAQKIAGTVSLAGLVPDAAPYPLPERHGGFGGPGGLARYLIDGRFTALIDATHPFAATMPWHAAQAARLAGVPWAMLKRSPWLAEPGDVWVNFPTLEAAIRALPRGARAFLAAGAGAMAAAETRPDCHLILRQMTDPKRNSGGPMSHVTVLRGRPGNRTEETDLLRGLAVSHLIAKNSGGPAGGKLLAARDLRLPVHMVTRPGMPPGLVHRQVAETLAWIEGMH